MFPPQAQPHRYPTPLISLVGLTLALVLTVGCRSGQLTESVAVVTPTAVESAPPATLEPSAPSLAPTTAPPPTPTLPVVAASTATAVQVQPAAPAAAAGLPAPQQFSGQRAHRDVVHLAQTIGSRVAGTTGIERAADYLVDQFGGAGLSAERLPFTYSGFVDRGAQLEVVRPAGAQLTPRTLTYSAAGEVTAALAQAGLGRPDDFVPAEVRGKIGLVQRGEIRFSDKVANLAAAGAVGVVIYNHLPGNFSGSLGTRSDLPTVSISAEEGEQLLARVQQAAVTVRLRVDADVREQRGVNVQATRPGGEGLVIIGAHFDSVAAGPGANDNASGTAVLLELARVIATRQYPFTVRLVAFDAEEIGLIGSRHYASELETATREQVLAMINLDMIGVGERQAFGGESSLVQRAIRLAAEQGVVGGQLRGGVGAASDHASFQALGVPSLFVYRGEDPHYHTADDKPEFVLPEHLESAGRIVIGLLDELAVGTP